MSDLIIRATLPAAMDLLKRWYLMELNDRDIRIDTMRMLQATGRIPKLGEIDETHDQKG